MKSLGWSPKIDLDKRIYEVVNWSLKMIDNLKSINHYESTLYNSCQKRFKAIKNKNIIKIKGKYLFAYSIEFAKKLKFLDKIIFSSDSKDYIKKAKKFKNIYFNFRPKKYSTDKSLMVDYIKYQLEKEKNRKFYDCVLLLQVTCL